MDHGFCWSLAVFHCTTPIRHSPCSNQYCLFVFNVPCHGGSVSNPAFLLFHPAPIRYNYFQSINVSRDGYSLLINDRAYDSAGISGGKYILGDIPCHNASSSDNGSCSDSHTRAYDGSPTNPNIISNFDWLAKFPSA